MRKQVIAFICAVLVTLAIVPVLNILSNTRLSPTRGATDEREAWWTYASYNLDSASAWINGLLYQLGISTDPAQVVIGRQGWLYLGDRYEKVRSVARIGQTSADVTQGCKIASALEAWETWLTGRGVRIYAVMAAPNKGTIYPEHLPNWAKPAASSATDVLIGCEGKQRVLDLRPALLLAKNEASNPLYYRTDTHWNSLGAAYGFSALMSQLLVTEPTLNWEPEQAIGVVRVDSRSGGDLARFLRLQQALTDDEPVVALLANPSIETTQYEFESQKIIRAGGNPVVAESKTPLHVVSPHAPNRKKVLWLRDSFGTALAPFMAATFTETVQVHWNEALKSDGELLIELVDTWHPDYLVMTVVERYVGSGLFTTLPQDGAD